MIVTVGQVADTVLPEVQAVDNQWLFRPFGPFWFPFLHWQIDLPWEIPEAQS